MVFKPGKNLDLWSRYTVVGVAQDPNIKINEIYVVDELMYLVPENNYVVSRLHSIDGSLEKAYSK